MDIEVRWRETEEWHACIITSIGETIVDIHYPKTPDHEEFDETLLREEMVRFALVPLTEFGA